MIEPWRETRRDSLIYALGRAVLGLLPGQGGLLGARGRLLVGQELLRGLLRGLGGPRLGVLGEAPVAGGAVLGGDSAELRAGDVRRLPRLVGELRIRGDGIVPRQRHGKTVVGHVRGAGDAGEAARQRRRARRLRAVWLGPREAREQRVRRAPPLERPQLGPDRTAAGQGRPDEADDVVDALGREHRAPRRGRDGDGREQEPVGPVGPRQNVVPEPEPVLLPQALRPAREPEFGTLFP